MVLDAVLILIFLWSIKRGSRRGLGDSLIRLLSLAASIVLGVLGTEKLADVFRVFQLDETIADNLSEAVQSDSIDITAFMPKSIAELVNLFGADSTTLQVTKLADTLVTVLSFLIIVNVIWALATGLRRKLKRSKEKGGFIGTVDSTIGLLLGALKGALLVLLLLAFMFPLAGIFAPDSIPALTGQLDSSLISGYLYNNNPLLMFIGGR